MAYGFSMLDPEEKLPGYLRGIGRGLSGLHSAIDPFSPLRETPDRMEFLTPESYLNPMEAGQKKALGVDATQPTFPPRTPTAPAKTETPGIPDQFKGNPSPLISNVDPEFAREMAQRRVESESRIKFDPDGAGPLPMQEMAPRGDDTRGRSEMDWSKVAAPEAFAGFRALPEGLQAAYMSRDPQGIKAQQAIMRDPLWAERERAGIDVQKAAGIYGAQRRADAGIQDQRAASYRAQAEQEMNAAQDAIARLKTMPGLTPEQVGERERLIGERLEERMRVLREGAGYSKETRRADG